MINSILYLGDISERNMLKAALGRLAAVDLSLDRASTEIAEILAMLPQVMDKLDLTLSRLPEGEDSSRYRAELIELRGELEKAIEKVQKSKLAK